MFTISSKYNVLDYAGLSGKKRNPGYKKPLPVWLHGLFSPCRTVVDFSLFEYLQRQKYIYIANSLNTIHLKKAFCVLLPLNFILPLLKTRQKRNITSLENSKVLLDLAGQMWLSDMP